MFIRDQDSIVLALTVVESDITNENKLGFALFSYHFFLTAWRTVVSCTPNTSDPSFRGTQTLNCLLTTLVEGLHSPSSANRTPHELTGAGRSSEAPPRLAAPSSPCSAPCPRAPRAFLQAGREPSSLHLEQVLRCAALKALFSGRTASLKSLWTHDLWRWEVLLIEWVSPHSSVCKEISTLFFCTFSLKKILLQLSPNTANTFLVF